MALNWTAANIVVVTLAHFLLASLLPLRLDVDPVTGTVGRSAIANLLAARPTQLEVTFQANRIEAVRTVDDGQPLVSGRHTARLVVPALGAAQLLHSLSRYLIAVLVEELLPDGVRIGGQALILL